MMIPENSSEYTFRTKVAPASFPRVYRAIKDGVRRNILKVCYRKYTSTSSNEDNLPSFNLVFLHGTGMNKGIWHSVIDQLYNEAKSSGIHINTCLTIDAVNHGESAEANKEYLGDGFDWRDGSYDVLKVVENEADTFLDSSSKNIIVGHSMGGMMSLYLSYLQPQLFDSCIVINPVCFTNGEVEIIRDVLVPKGYMDTEFDVPKGESWENVVFKYMRTGSFFRRFEETVLKNMIDDEVPKNTYGKKLDKIALRTSRDYALATYMGSQEALPPMGAVLPYIRIPVVRLLSEKDTAPMEHRERLEKAVPNIKTIHFKGKKHILNGEDPALTLKTLLNVFVERSTAPPTKFPFISIKPKL